MTSTKKPLVSVHIVTYNQIQYIRQAIDSVLNQKVNFNYEIIIGDDCSTDGTKEIIEYYANQYNDKIFPVYNNINKGFLENWKQTYLQCKGKYIAFLEGDDFWTDEYKLQKQVDFLEANPDYGLIHTDYNRWYERSGITINDYNKTNRIHFPDGYIFDFFIDPSKPKYRNCTSVFRKEIIDQYFNIEIAIQNNWKTLDLPLGLIVAKYSKIKYLSETTATYRILNDSISNTFNPQKKIKFHFSVFNIYQHYLLAYNCDETIVKKVNIFFYKSFLFDSIFTVNKDLAQLSYYNLKKLKGKLSLSEKLMYNIVRYKIINILILNAYKLIKH
jgi:glycosyltransferase involved in cell wall biosynthesis